MLRRTYILIIGLFFICFGCKKLEIESETFVYFNDFESEDYTGINGVFISEFDNSKVMGLFNNSGFTLSLNDLPDHEFIRVFFDIYIHDSWEGNANMSNGENLGPDLWVMEFDPDENIKTADKIRFETTFSNGLCIPGWCFSQSYPSQFPFQNDARKGAKPRTTFGRCLWQDNQIGTSIYRIDRIFPHDRANTVISFYDRLIHDSQFSLQCDESWSLDNLSVSVFSKQ